MSKQKPLRFAALIRVSSEKQERQGESLNTQATQIEQAVEAMEGRITARYAGQEHATAGWEREQFERLLQDAASPRRKFDAVIVADPSRWSRDNGRSEPGLDLLRDNHIRFFAMLQEYDLHDPHARGLLEMTTAMNGWQAALLAQKSVLNRLSKLRKGELAVGELPFGRTYSKQTRTWGLDEEKARIIREIAERYIAGESLDSLAKEYGIGRSRVDRVLRERCGPDWTVRFDSDRFNIHEEVIVRVPPLLDARTIEAVRKTAEANKTYKHGQNKNRYLFSRMVFCGICGRALRGAETNGYRYHQHTFDIPNCLCGSVRADDLEDIVMRHLFETFGNPEAVQRAIEEATPNAEKNEESRKRAEQIGKELGKIQSGRERLLGFIARGTITDAQAEKQLDELNERENGLREQLDRLTEHLDKVPPSATILEAAQNVSKRFRERVSAKKWVTLSHLNRAFEDMTWEDKRAVAEAVFAGKDSDGRRMGIYIFPVNGQAGKQRRRWKYEIHGLLIDEEGFFPMSPETRDSFFVFGASPGQKRLLSKSQRSSTPRSRTSTSFRSVARGPRSAGSTWAGPACASAASGPAPACGQPSACCT